MIRKTRKKSMYKQMTNKNKDHIQTEELEGNEVKRTREKNRKKKEEEN